jgi:hypothetical protein
MNQTTTPSVVMAPQTQMDFARPNSLPANGQGKPPPEGACRPPMGWSGISPQSRRLWMFFPQSRALQQRECFSKDFPMAPRPIATVLILFAFATTGANLASAQGGGSGGSGFRGGGLHGGGGGDFHGRGAHGSGFHGRGFRGPGFVGYGILDGYGYGYDNGYPDWYGISSGYDPCPLFRQRVMTRDGWRVRMIPVC